MATLGYTTTPSFGSFGEGFNVGDQVGLAVTTPAGNGIYISVIHCYAQSFNGTDTMKLVVWDGSGNVLTSGTASAASSPSSPAWVTFTLSSLFFVAGSTNLFIGWANPNNTASDSGFTAHYDQAGGTLDWNLQGSAPGNLLSGATQLTNRNIGAYVDYSLAVRNLFAFDGSQDQHVSWFAYDGSHLQPVKFFAFDGSALQGIYT